MTSIPTKRGRGKARSTIELIEKAFEILQVIQPASVRAVCYQLFNAGVIKSMAKSETNKVSTQLTWARENNIIPWSWIVDETREAEVISAWKDPANYFHAVKHSYRKDRWVDQDNWVEVWSEKGTIRGSLAPVLNDYGLTFRVMHGYSSATTVYQVASETMSADRKLIVLYVGDWDPSGMHMSAVDLPKRIEEYGGWIELCRLALNDDDVAPQTDLPWFSAEDKRKDPRYRWFVENFGRRCWELDALSPVVLRQRVEEAVRHLIDFEAWNRAEVVEAAEKESIVGILSRWPGISGPASKYSSEAV